MASVAIIGGGISGLSVAYYLSKLSASNVKKIVLYEASNRLGGWIRTSRFDDGSLFECGPRSIRPVGVSAQTTLSLAEEIGLSDQVISIPRSHPAAKNRMIYANGRLNVMPNSLSDLFRVKPPLTGRLFPKLMKELLVPRTEQEDETVHDFFRRRLGDEVATYYADAMCHGIFAGDSRKLSMRSCFKDIWSYEQQFGSVLRGAIAGSPSHSAAVNASELSKKAKQEKWAIWSFKRGMEELPKGLESSLSRDPRVEVRLNHPVSGLCFGASSGVDVHSTKHSETFSHVISCIYAGKLADILPDKTGEIRDNLRSIPAVNVAVLNAEFSGNHIPTPGFGFLVPSCENLKILGVIFDSFVFDEHNKAATTKLTLMMGGARYQRHFGEFRTGNGNGLLEAGLDALKQCLNIHQIPSRLTLSVLENCIPQYLVGHHTCIDKIRQEIEDQKFPLTVIGASYDGVSINDCVHGGRLAAEKFIANRV